MLASLGINEVGVYRKLRVAFFSTGDELRSIGQPLGDRRDLRQQPLHALRHADAAQLRHRRHGRRPDVPDALERAFASAAASADVVITSGGVSVGEADYVSELLDKLGEVLFWKIAMKPGRPLAYGRIGDAHFFGLPGNPVSVMVTFYEFVRDALLVLQGRRDVAPHADVQGDARAADPQGAGPNRVPARRPDARRRGRLDVRTTGDQGSGILSSMSQANCFIVLPADAGNLEPGAPVDVQLLEGLL